MYCNLDCRKVYFDFNECHDNSNFQIGCSGQRLLVILILLLVLILQKMFVNTGTKNITVCYVTYVCCTACMLFQRIRLWGKRKPSKVYGNTHEGDSASSITDIHTT